MARQIPSQKQQAELVATWNARHPENTPVTVTLDDGSTKDTVTESAAWLLGGHTAVIMVSGISGAYSLDRVRPLPLKPVANP